MAKYILIYVPKSSTTPSIVSDVKRFMLTDIGVVIYRQGNNEPQTIAFDTMKARAYTITERVITCKGGETTDHREKGYKPKLDWSLCPTKHYDKSVLDKDLSMLDEEKFAMAVMACFIHITGKKVKLTRARVRMVANCAASAAQEGFTDKNKYTLSDFIAVIKYVYNSKKDDPNQQQYIRPDTAFATANFSRYMAQVYENPAHNKNVANYDCGVTEDLLRKFPFLSQRVWAFRYKENGLKSVIAAYNAYVDSQDLTGKQKRY